MFLNLDSRPTKNIFEHFILFIGKNPKKRICWLKTDILTRLLDIILSALQYM